MNKYPLHIENINEILEIFPDYKKVCEENIFFETDNYRAKNTNTLIYQSVQDENKVYSKTDFIHTKQSLKEVRSVEFLNLIKENDPEINTMKKTVYKKGDYEFVVQYDHPLIKKPLFFYFIKKCEYVERIYSQSNKFLSIGVDVSDFDSFSEKALLMLNEDCYGINFESMIKGVCCLMNTKLSDEQIALIKDLFYDVNILKESKYGEIEQYDQQLTEEEFNSLCEKYNVNMNFVAFQLFEKAVEEVNHHKLPDQSYYVFETFKKAFANIESVYCSIKYAEMEKDF